MNLKPSVVAGLLASSLFLPNTNADERRFTYVYEPETLPQGAAEIENWVTLRAGRNQTVGKENYNRWDLRQEFEYGVTDRYTLSLYMNEKAESYRDSAGNDVNDFEWKGISLENIYNVVNPADNPVGLSLYLEGTYSGEEAAVEEKNHLWSAARGLEMGAEPVPRNRMGGQPARNRGRSRRQHGPSPRPGQKLVAGSGVP